VGRGQILKRRIEEVYGRKEKGESKEKEVRELSFKVSIPWARHNLAGLLFESRPDGSFRLPRRGSSPQDTKLGTSSV
jgi:hypothetical protein